MPFVHMTKRMSAARPALVNHFSPLMTHSSPVADGVGLEEVRVGASLRLGHGVGRPHLLVEQRLQPPLLLLLRAVGGEHLHVPGIGRGRPEDRRCRAVASEDLVDEGELQLPEPGAAEFLVEEERP